MKPLEVAVRRAAPADVALLAALNAQVQELHVRAEPDLYHEPDAREVRALFAERLASPDVVIFIASAGDPLGYAVTVHRRLSRNAFSPARERLVLEEIGVDAARRRLGVGRLLMQAVEQRAAELGLRDVQLDVRAFNTDARRFYEALGYVPVQLRLERRRP